ncbi:MAG: response regulator [Candidatus Coatesbacteria bacterium]|nr:response regulator [Candidatus Coatesbacteria bacterium]
MEQNSSILVVEDSAGLRENLVQTLSMGGYSVQAADNGHSALEILETESFDVIITDIRMPGMDGLALLDQVLAMDGKPETAVILMTAYMTIESAVSSLKKGAYDYITKPFKIEQLLHTVETVIDKRRLKLENVRLNNELKELNRELEEKVRLRTKQLQESQNELQENYLQVIKSFAVVLEERDAYTQGHSSRVTEYSVRIANEMGLPEGQIIALQIGGNLHDIGKIGIPEEVLRKPTRLTDDEWRVMREHPIKGARMVEPLSFLSKERILIKHHHERWDGRGYPDGLAGEEIPLLSRILCVADSFDAMTSTRSYRRRMALATAIAQIEENRGTQFDPRIVDVFMNCLKEFGIITSMDCVILAAGKGKRMNSDRPKVLTQLRGRPLLGYVLDLMAKFGMHKTYIVVGHGANEVKEFVQSTYLQGTTNNWFSAHSRAHREELIEFVQQKEQLGTAHAVAQVLPHLVPSRNSMLILSGDVPLLSFNTINKLIDEQMRTDAGLVLATADLDDPGSLGRIVRNEEGELKAIVEACEASEEELAIKEINVGAYCLSGDRRFLDFLGKVENDNSQGEYYLTDAIRLFMEKGNRVRLCKIADSRESLGINTIQDLERAEKYIDGINLSAPLGTNFP